MSYSTYGLVLMITGVIYIIKPNIFRIGFWKKTAVTQKTFNAKQYNVYMRTLGFILLALGVYFYFFIH